MAPRNVGINSTFDQQRVVINEIAVDVDNLLNAGYATTSYVGLATAGLASTTYVINSLVGFVTSGVLSDYATTSSLVGFVTSGVLVGYATTGYVNNLISGISTVGGGGTGGSSFDQDLNTTNNVTFNRIGITTGEINVGYNNSLSIYMEDAESGVSTYTFDTVGNLTLPGNIYIGGNSGYVLFNNGGSKLQAEPTNDFEIHVGGFNNKVTGFGTDGSLTVPGTITLANGLKLADSGSGLPGNFGFIGDETTDVLYLQGQNGVVLAFPDGLNEPYGFLFDASGITFPDSTVQTTAYTGGGGGESYWVSTAGVGIHTTSNVGIGTTNPTSKLTVEGDVSVSGVVTATSFSGSGANLTNIPAGQLTGALPAIDGSALTGITATGSGVEIRDSGTPVGTAATIDFGTNLSVSPVSAGVVTVTASGGGGGESYWVSTVAGIHTTSNVGIGSTIPVTNLDVEGDARITGSLGVDGILYKKQTPIYFDENNLGEVQIVGSGNNLKFYNPVFGPGGDWIFDTYSYGEVVRITNSGNVGIGSTIPTTKLDVDGDVNISGYLGVDGILYKKQTPIYFDENNMGEVQIVGSGNNLKFYNPVFGSGGDWIFDTYSYGEVVRITNGGLVGIGTDSPQARAHIYGTGYSALIVQSVPDEFLVQNSSISLTTEFDGSFRLQTGTEVSGGFRIYDGVAQQERLRITSGFAGGNVGIGTTNPTSKLTVRDGDISVGINTLHGLILSSPNGTKYRLIVNNSGTLSTVLA